MNARRKRFTLLKGANHYATKNRQKRCIVYLKKITFKKMYANVNDSFKKNALIYIDNIQKNVYTKIEDRKANRRMEI